MNPKWFEPGNSENNLSPFEREYHLAHANDTAESISAAFRALLAEDVQANIRDAELFEQQVLNDDPPALRVGDVVRLEAYNNNSMPSWVGREATIVEARRKNCIGYVTVKTDGIDYNFGWETAALTLVRRAGDAAPVANDAEIARLRAEVERLTVEPIESARVITIRNQRNELAALNKAYGQLRAEFHREIDRLVRLASEFKAERDALQARIDAGVRVYFPEPVENSHERGGVIYDCSTAKWDSDERTGILLIDAQPIDHIADAGKMADERTGKADRREVGCDASYEARIAVGREHTRKYINQNDCNGTVKCARSNDRRRTAGTRADRKGC